MRFRSARFPEIFAHRRPEAKKINVAELVDNRFVKGLEESGFVKTLYDGK
jgi:hypothetical protein